MRADLLVLVLLLAGCVQAPTGQPAPPSTPEPVSPPLPQPLPSSCELDDCAFLWYNATVYGAGEWRALLPLPEILPYTPMAAWARNATAQGAAEIALSEDGRFLDVRGEDEVLLQSHAFAPPTQRGNQCCAEDFLDREWTSEDGKVIAVLSGNATSLVLTFEAHASHCDAEDRFEAEGTGRIELGPTPGGGVCS